MARSRSSDGIHASLASSGLAPDATAWSSRRNSSRLTSPDSKPSTFLERVPRSLMNSRHSRRLASVFANSMKLVPNLALSRRTTRPKSWVTSSNSPTTKASR